jgi:hypothetical protein
VAFKDTVSGQFSIWNVNSSGNYISNIVGIAPGSSSAVQAQEPAFHQDLNGDGIIGAPSAPPPSSTTIESVGTTTLVQVGNNYYLNPAGGGTGPVLSYNGTPVVPGQYNGYLPYAAEATASGYVVAFKDTVSGQFSIWNVNSSGNYISNIVGIAPGSSSAVQGQEPAFHQDLNGDGVIGVPVVSPNTGLAGGGSFLFSADRAPTSAIVQQAGGTDTIAFQPLDSHGVAFAAALVTVTASGSSTAIETTQGFDFRPDVGSQTPNLHVQDDKMSEHLPVHSLADEIRSLIHTAPDHLPATPAPEADSTVQKVLAAHSDQFLFH